MQTWLPSCLAEPSPIMATHEAPCHSAGGGLDLELETEDSVANRSTTKK